MTGSNLMKLSCAVTKEELQTYENLQKLTVSKNTKEISHFLDLFKAYSLETLAKILFYNSAIQDFVKSNNKANEILSQKLKEKGNPSIPLSFISKNQSKTFSLVDHALADFLLIDYVTTSRRGANAGLTKKKKLDEACELGSFKGRIIRSKNNITNLYANKGASCNLDKTINMIVTDIDYLASLYGALGYIVKGYFLSELSLYDAKLNKPDSSKLKYRQSVVQFLCAEILLEGNKSNPKHANSITLLDDLSNGGSVSDFFTNITSSEFESWESMKNCFRNNVGDDVFALLVKQSDSEVKSYLQLTSPLRAL